ncbi:pilus assembly protein CpaF [Robbsia andropogonis]|uniref:Pilus assembly protein CpaF n=1 Tax=Robbsia andropogonis TaxID=28092 RepID=A0A0F5K0T7_9BURK|nr:CpaF family protein [Robbsia andropogonis]KKB63162.1 pilus assembly protein CpaF [Robbsia andropogonis]MCP1117562.1 CpaF family protein [Robbsia andropogonis]MCP1127028.1 CpaF family protein [Robbsia andropogonis]
MLNEIEFADDSASGFVHSQRFAEIKSAVHAHLLSRIEELGTEFGRWSRRAIEQFVELEVDGYVRLRRVGINENELKIVVDSLTKELVGLGPLEDLLQDVGVEDILINGFEDVFVSRKGVLRREAVRFTDNQHVLRIVRRVLAPLGRRIDESNPMVDARLPDGGRLNVVIEPLAVDGPMVSIRKFRKQPLTPEELLAMGTMDRGIYQLLRLAVKGRCNILVSGGTSSGKTSLLNALASFINESERILTVEDTAELSLNHPHVVRLESRHGTFEGSGEVTIRDLIRNSLRMRPDRVVVGEVRGAEVLEMLQAMNTGHDGSMATIHANNPRECLYRIEMLAGFAGYVGSESSLRRQIASALDFIIQIGRLPGGQRRILSVTEVTGYGDNIVTTQELFRHETRVDGDGNESDFWHALGVAPHTPKLARFRDQLLPGNLQHDGNGQGEDPHDPGAQQGGKSAGGGHAGGPGNEGQSWGGWFGRK